MSVAPWCKAADTGVAICPEQVEVVSVDDAIVFNFRRDGRLVAGDQTAIQGQGNGIQYSRSRNPW